MTKKKLFKRILVVFFLIFSGILPIIVLLASIFTKRWPWTVIHAWYLMGKMFAAIDFPDQYAWCPRCSIDGQLGTIIAHLNDDHTWSFEQIANWLDTKEPVIIG